MVTQEISGSQPTADKQGVFIENGTQSDFIPFTVEYLSSPVYFFGQVFNNDGTPMVT
jgi:hypothetical protein